MIRLPVTRGQRNRYYQVELSPDGRSSGVSTNGSGGDLWTFDDLATRVGDEGDGPTLRMTTRIRCGSPVDDRVDCDTLTGREAEGRFQIFCAGRLDRRPARRSCFPAIDGTPPGSWPGVRETPDGQTAPSITADPVNGSSGRDIWMLPVDGDSGARP